MKPIYVVDGVRTPFADYNGALASVSPTDLGIKAGRAAIAKTGLPAGDKARIQALNTKAQQAIQGYIQRLEALGKEQAATGKGRSFRLGQPLYDAKFRYDIQATVDAKTLALQYLDMMKAMGASPATKFVIPMEFTNLMRPFVAMTEAAVREEEKK